MRKKYDFSKARRNPFWQQLETARDGSPRALMAGAKDLRCPSCRRWYALEEAFDHCTGAWPGIGSSSKSNWLSFRCKRCRVRSSLVLGPRTVTIGGIDGGPGPCFIPSGRVSVDYTLSRSKAGLKVRYAGREWTFLRR